MSNEFQQVIKAYLDKRAEEDALFAENYAKPNKSIEKCCNYIMQQAKKRGNAVAMTDDEVYGLAVHYYDEDIKADECKPVSGGSRVNTNAQKAYEELTEEEKAAAREQALAKYRDEQVAAMRREEREKKQREAQRQRERKEKFESMQLSIFDQ